MKEITNLSILKRFEGFFKSFLKPWIFPIQGYYASKRKFLSSYIKPELFQDLQKINEKFISFSIDNFKSPNCLYNWSSFADNEKGGDSQADLFFDPQENSLLFKGKLKNESHGLLPIRIYAGCMSTFISRIDLKYFNGIRIKYKSDGNLYKVLMRVNTNFDLDHHIYAYIRDNSKEWQTMELPFTYFLTEKFHVRDKPIFMEGYCEKFILKSFSVYIDGEKNLDFEFHVQDVEFIYRSDYSKILQDYAKPYFFKIEEGILNSGREIFDFKKDQNAEVKRPSVFWFEETPNNKKEFSVKNKLNKNKEK